MKGLVKNMKTSDLDLHGLTWTEALEEFINVYNSSLEQENRNGGIHLEVIHGYGSTGEGGVIRTRLRAFLRRFGDRLEFTPGEEMDGNQGHTLVRPFEKLPGINGLLAEEIWNYCQQPKPLSKIAGKFRQHGESNIMGAVRSLEKQGRLKKNGKSGLVKYESA